MGQSGVAGRRRDVAHQLPPAERLESRHRTAGSLNNAAALPTIRAGVIGDLHIAYTGPARKARVAPPKA